VTVILVGHVTKDGQIAGPKLLEHMVDTVLYLEGDKEHLFRILRVVKNRFGPANELLLFEMREQGMAVIEDPSTFFLQARDTALSGTACHVHGVQRPFGSSSGFGHQNILAFRAVQPWGSTPIGCICSSLSWKSALASIWDRWMSTPRWGRLTHEGSRLDLGIVVVSFHLCTIYPCRSAVFWGEVD
jgi:DNA repair protein RadA/Sms